MPHGLQSRAGALADGMTVASLDRAVNTGRLPTAARGLYVVTPGTGPDERWLQELTALVHRCPTAAVARRSAALLHGLDGFQLDWTSSRPIEVLVPMSARLRDPRASRTRTLLDSQVSILQDLRVTDPVRTIADLGAVCVPDEVELALESVLRGPDPRQPDVWFPDRLASLHELVAKHPRVPGHRVASEVVRRRGVGLPSGSAAETRVWIACRKLGLTDLGRQICIRRLDRRGRVLWRAWADVGQIARRTLVEIDGAHHQQSDRVVRDHLRDNELQREFTVLRYPAPTTSGAARTIAHDIRSHLHAVAPMPLGGRLVPTPLGVDIRA